MAKFCGYCGTKADDSMRFCPACGQPFPHEYLQQDASPAQPEPPMRQQVQQPVMRQPMQPNAQFYVAPMQPQVQQPAPKKGMKTGAKIGIAAGALVVIAVVVFVLIKVFSGGSDGGKQNLKYCASYEDAFATFFAGIEEKNEEKVNKSTWVPAGYSGSMLLNDEDVKAIEKVDYRILEAQSLDTDDINEAKEDLEENGFGDLDQIEAGYEIKFTYSWTYSDGREETDSDYLYAFKTADGWRITVW